MAVENSGGDAQKGKGSIINTASMSGLISNTRSRKLLTTLPKRL